MTPNILAPHLPLHDDELGQGYFARTGYFHAGVNAVKFCRYSGVDRFDLRHGTETFIKAMAAMTGSRAEEIATNTLRARSDNALELRGERLRLPVVRRTFVRFCPHCLHDDAAFHLGTGDAARRFRWAWLLRPVVICPEHGVVLTELPAPDAVRAFDLPKLLVDHDFMLPEAPTLGISKPGALQAYVMDRLVGRKNAVAWLEDQDVASGVKACEMLGALIDGGPEAQISGHTEVDWARVGDIGFQICAQGPDAILGVLAALRVSRAHRPDPEFCPVESGAAYPRLQQNPS